ncbi:MAG: type I toxin-antitoxin system Fst family toxin [Staphylococcus rostri]|nr:type I toxin-antitoxin system Fst family toxin [Staphylococcus rostri]MDO5376010.1 type I toxin-antitoxin system Fst family toxin [Staphylococcus rostri]
MHDLVIHIATTVISGCIVALFAHWLRKRDEHNNRR